MKFSSTFVILINFCLLLEQNAVAFYYYSMKPKETVL